LTVNFMCKAGRKERAAFGPVARFTCRLIGREFDAIVVSGYRHPISLLSCVLARLRGVPVILGLDTVATTRPWYRRLFRGGPVRFLYRGASCFWVPGKASEEHLLGQGVGGERIFQGMYWLDVDALVREATQLEKARGELRRQLSLAERDFWFLMVARLIPTRNVLALLRAFEQARLFTPEIGLMIVGDGPDRSSAEHYVLMNGLSNVRLFPQVDFWELGKFYVAADAFVMPSQEPYSLAVAEAAIFAKPVIAATGVGATMDYVVPDRTGFVYEGSSVTALSRAMAKMAGSPTEARRMGQAGRAVATGRSRAWVVGQLRAAVSHALAGPKGVTQ